MKQVMSRVFWFLLGSGATLVLQGNSIGSWVVAGALVIDGFNAILSSKDAEPNARDGVYVIGVLELLGALLIVAVTLSNKFGI